MSWLSERKTQSKRVAGSWSALDTDLTAGEPGQLTADRQSEAVPRICR